MIVSTYKNPQIREICCSEVPLSLTFIEYGTDYLLHDCKSIRTTMIDPAMKRKSVTTEREMQCRAMFGNHRSHLTALCTVQRRHMIPKYTSNRRVSRGKKNTVMMNKNVWINQTYGMYFVQKYLI